MILSLFSSSPILVLGLGNPGKEYAGTRHNAGADAVRLFAKREGFVFERKEKLFAEVAETRFGRERVVIACPTVAMNQSGKAAATLLQFFRVKPQKVIVVHDDMDIPIGTIKVVFDRGSGGHKGVESVFRAVGTRGLARIRIGTMGRGRSQKPGQRELADVVLKRMTADEQTQFKKGVKQAADALKDILEHGREYAMTEYN